MNSKRENSPQPGIVRLREFHNANEIHHRITPAAPSNSFSKDNGKSQPQPQMEIRSSMHHRFRRWELNFDAWMRLLSFSLQNCLFARYAWMSFRHMTSFCVLNRCQSVSGSSISNKPARLGKLHQNLKIKRDFPVKWSLTGILWVIGEELGSHVR